MTKISLMPIVGMNTEVDDKALHRSGEAPRHFVREAINIDITASGEIALRQGVRKVSSTPFKNLWQSPLHGDTFATVGEDWVKVDPVTWTYETLATTGADPVCHTVLNNQVVMSGPNGIFVYDGQHAQPLTLTTPAAPFVQASHGSLLSARYGVALAWLRNGQESGLSEMTQVDLPNNGALEITFPLCLDSTVTGIRLYLTEPDGGELRREQDYPLNAGVLTVTAPPQLGAAAQLRNLSPMPPGQFIHYWRGRLITTKANVIRFSEPLAYHLHDERSGFILMPQRITFIQPVEGGLWVGQVDHVSFVRGAALDEMVITRKMSGAPIPGSSILIDADAIGGELSGGGSGAALWLARNGYVLGTADGQLVEVQRGVIGGVVGRAATSVELDRRVVTAVV